MRTNEVLARLQGVRGGGGQWTARCPAHDDKQNSLSVSEGGDGRVLLHCHAGCDTRDILDALGLTDADLFPDSPKRVLESDTYYDYRDSSGTLIAQKIRRPGKKFSWRQPDGQSGWIYNRKGVPYRLYTGGKLTGTVCVCEGEKDVDTLRRLGYSAACGMDGAGPGKWKPEYTEQLRGHAVWVFPDNDDVGRAYAVETCNALHGVASSVRLLDLSKVWPEIPEHGDVSDMAAALGSERTREMIGRLMEDAPEWEPKAFQAEDPLLSLFKLLEDFPEEEAKWLVPGWIPEGQISVIAADGGIGKTTLWCHVIAALSNGSACILDPPGHTRAAIQITFLTTEDSVRKKLRKKLRLAGANMKNIITPDFAGDRDGLLRKVKFGTPEMDKVLRSLRPMLVIFDPVQGFTPPKVNMGSRNEMRDCMAPLIAIGEEINTTAIIVCHTNKRKGAYGRDRIADSADIWDIARSVMMAGFAEEQGVRYLSNEKNNYGPLQETILFTIDDDGQIQKSGTSWKRDREYILGAETAKSAPKREDCKDWVLQTLDIAGGSMITKDLETQAKAAGYSHITLRRAKDELKQSGDVKYFATGSAKEGDRVWHIQRVDQQSFTELPADTPHPWSRQTSANDQVNPQTRINTSFF